MPDSKRAVWRGPAACSRRGSRSAGGTLTVSDSRKLFEARAAPGRTTIPAGYSVSPDGRRLPVLLLDPRAVPTRIGVFLDWFAELEAKVPAR